MRRILADVDTGVDDALALLWMVASPAAELAAVTTTAGNTTARQSALNSAAVLALAGAGGVEVAAGADAPLKGALVTTPETHGDDGLGWAVLPRSEISARSVVDVWRDEVERHPGECTLLVTGPATNLARVWIEAPEVVAGFGRIVMMVGSFDHPGNTTPTAEWNAWVDPHALDVVWRAAADWAPERRPVLLSLQVTEACELTPALLDDVCRRRGARPLRLSAEASRGPGRSDLGDPVADFLTDALRFYFEFHHDWGYGYLAQVHDLCAAQVAAGVARAAIRPEWVGVETADVLTRGTTVWNRRGLWQRQHNVGVVSSLDTDAVLAEFASAVGGDG